MATKFQQIVLPARILLMFAKIILHEHVCMCLSQWFVLFGRQSSIFHFYICVALTSCLSCATQTGTEQSVHESKHKTSRRVQKKQFSRATKMQFICSCHKICNWNDIQSHPDCSVYNTNVSLISHFACDNSFC